MSNQERNQALIGAAVTTPAGLDGTVTAVSGRGMRAELAIRTADGLEYWPADYYNQAEAAELGNLPSGRYATATRPAALPWLLSAMPAAELAEYLHRARVAALEPAPIPDDTKGPWLWYPTAEALERATAQTDRQLAALEAYHRPRMRRMAASLQAEVDNGPGRA